jgi:hypothetical protein
MVAVIGVAHQLRLGKELDITTTLINDIAPNQGV